MWNTGYQRLGKGGKRELVFHGYRVSVWADESVLEMDGSDGYTTT